MSKHTSGPWSVPHMARDEVQCDCAYVLAEPYMGSICTISISDGKTIGEFGNDCPPLDEAKANARLIAAAPDLLDALQEMVQWQMDSMSGKKTKGYPGTQAMSAIRKALGEDKS